MTDKDAQKRCCQWNRKSMTITITVCIASVLILVALIIRFHANVRPDEKYASIGTIPFPAITICPGIRSGYPSKNNFNRTLFLMQTEAAPKLRPRKYEGHSVSFYNHYDRPRRRLSARCIQAHACRQACTASVYARAHSQSLCVCAMCTILWPGFSTFLFLFPFFPCLFSCFVAGRKIALETLFQLCDWDIFRRVRNWDILERYVDEEDQMEAFNQIASDIDENAKICAWHRRTSCDEYFRPIVTNEGRCYTFVNDLFISLNYLVSNHMLDIFGFCSSNFLLFFIIAILTHANSRVSFLPSRIYWIPMKYSPEG